MRDECRVGWNHECQRGQLAEAVRKGSCTLDGRKKSAPWLRLAIVGIALLLTLGRGSNRVWAQEYDQRSQQPKRTAPAGKGANEIPPPPEGMSYTTDLDHTAVWVGDQFHYTIVVDYSPEYEFVLDTLSRETVNLEPFHVIDLGTKTIPLKSGNQRLFVNLILASYTTGKASEQIPQITLFYFRRDQRTAGAQEAAAESLTVPGPVIGLRTTLPPEPKDIRDAVTVSGWDRSRWWVAGTGWFSLIVLFVGVGWETVQFVKRKKTRKGPDRRKAMEAVRDRWVSGVPADFSNAQAVIEFYDRSYRDIKEYIGYYLETSAMGLTSEEFEAEMQRLGTDPSLAEKVVRTLGALETVRYSKNGTAPRREVAERTTQEVREIFAFGSKR
ncbi:MAG: hypothetical protein HY313_02990 [Acidobacteria bacterium]|nr:hypothetical protein [Acidobacteriota bacterium]